MLLGSHRYNQTCNNFIFNIYDCSIIPDNIKKISPRNPSIINYSNTNKGLSEQSDSFFTLIAQRTLHEFIYGTYKSDSKNKNRSIKNKGEKKMRTVEKFRNIGNVAIDSMETELTMMAINKLKDTFGFTVSIDNASKFKFVCLNFFKKYDRKYAKHISEKEYVFKATSSEYIFGIDKATYCLVEFNHHSLLDAISTNNSTNNDDYSNIKIYVFGKHSPKYVSELNDIMSKYNENLNVYFVSGSKDIKSDGERFDSIIDDMNNRDLDTLFFEDHVKESIIKHINGFLSNEKLYLSRSLLYKTGILLYGDPGTGKTSLATAIATKYRMDMIIIDMTTFAGLSVSRLTSSINADKRRYLVLLEDIDTMFNSLDRDDKSSESNKAVINKLLQFLDSNSSPTNVIFIATTNHPEKLDAALMRSGRFDLRVEVRGISKPIAIDMCKSFDLTDNQIDETLKDAEFPINQSLLQGKILATINKAKKLKESLGDSSSDEKTEKEKDDIDQEDNNQMDDFDVVDIEDDDENAKLAKDIKESFSKEPFVPSVVKTDSDGNPQKEKNEEKGECAFIAFLKEKILNLIFKKIDSDDKDIVNSVFEITDNLYDNCDLKLSDSTMHNFKKQCSEYLVYLFENNLVNKSTIDMAVNYIMNSFILNNDNIHFYNFERTKDDVLRPNEYFKLTVENLITNLAVEHNDISSNDKNSFFNIINNCTNDIIANLKVSIPLYEILYSKMDNFAHDCNICLSKLFTTTITYKDINNAAKDIITYFATDENIHFLDSNSDKEDDTIATATVKVNKDLIN